ncbi:hypothetical protein OS493_004789 [Desmophyllum pertusum]|uniref:Uncharacterized protein n=1 Tax=Desmophyllum pertusum TaxID=174260 RepID=A0A9W9ZJM5_9CNID|nr:hypothetical protein OS493_004789 [Desmophyllum pertusum]
MAVGQVGRRGAAVPPVFAREISEFEQELAPIRSQVKTESTVTKETVHSKWTAWLTAVSQNGVSGLSVTTRAGDPQSTGAGLVLTLPQPRTGNNVLETHFKPSWNALGRAQRDLFMAIGVLGVLGRNALKHVEYQEELV